MGHFLHKNRLAFKHVQFKKCKFLLVANIGSDIVLFPIPSVHFQLYQVYPRRHVKQRDSWKYSPVAKYERTTWAAFSWVSCANSPCKVLFLSCLGFLIIDSLPVIHKLFCLHNVFHSARSLPFCNYSFWCLHPSTLMKFFLSHFLG